jgi:hypothetical protein
MRWPHPGQYHGAGIDDLQINSPCQSHGFFNPAFVGADGGLVLQPRAKDNGAGHGWPLCKSVTEWYEGEDEDGKPELKLFNNFMKTIF